MDQSTYAGVRKWGAIGIGAGLALPVLLVFTVSPEVAACATLEGGLIELFSAIGYFMAAAALASLAVRARARDATMGIVLLLVCGLRELDFHHRFTVRSVTKLRFYTTADTPLLFRLLIAAALLALGVGAIRYARRQWQPFWSGFRRGDTHCLLVLYAVLLLPVSKVLDSLPRKLSKRGVELPREVVLRMGACEEVVEFIAPMLFLVAILLFARTCGGTSGRAPDIVTMIPEGMD